MYTPDDQSNAYLSASYDENGYDIPSLPYVPYTQYIEHSLPIEVAAPVDSIPLASPVPFVPVQEQAPSPKRRRRLWIPLGIAALLLLIIGGSLFPLVSYLNRSTPEKTLSTFCNALEKEAYQVAYDQLTANLQTQLTESQFASSLSADKIIQCTYGSTSEASTLTKTSLKLVHYQQHYVNNDVVTLTKQPDKIWRISDLSVAS